jgi:transcriptional regulator with XRE-family HTH domain
MSGGTIIREARLAEGLTQAQLATRLGVTQPAVARLEHTGDGVSVATLQRALNAMGRTLELRSVPVALGAADPLLVHNLSLTPHERLASFESFYEDMRKIAGIAQKALSERPRRSPPGGR